MPWYSGGSQPLDQLRMPSTGSPRVGQHDVGRQVLVLGAQAVGHPRPEARPAGDDQAGVHHPERLLVVAVLGEHRADDGDLVGVAGDVRQRLGELQAGLAVLGEPERAPSRLPVSFSSSATSAGGALPSYFASIGLGSSRSTWLGPPCMKSWITAFARAGACGGRGSTSNARGGPRSRRGPRPGARPGPGRRSRRRVATGPRGASGGATRGRYQEGDAASVRPPLVTRDRINRRRRTRCAQQHLAQVGQGRRQPAAPLLGQVGAEEALLGGGRRAAEGQPHRVARRVARLLAERPRGERLGLADQELAVEQAQRLRRDRRGRPPGAVRLHHRLVEDLQERQRLAPPDLEVDRPPQPRGRPA